MRTGRYKSKAACIKERPGPVLSSKDPAAMDEQDQRILIAVEKYRIVHHKHFVSILEMRDILEGLGWYND